MGQDDIVISVRSFYYDLHTWAAAEPEPLGHLGRTVSRRAR
ncbi:hypothetical protein ABZX75_25870 [Streptomyces sp. NPDC003038]